MKTAGNGGVIRISPRLFSVSHMVPPRGTVADIGTDHGKLCVWLIQTGRASRCIASDIRPLPLEAARKNILRYGLSDRIECRLGGGLSAVSAGEADTAVIAGMGGLTIRDIIAGAGEKGIKTFVLQPQSEMVGLKQWLFDNGFSIARETVCFDRRFYCIFTAVKDPATPPPPDEFYLPRGLECGNELAARYALWQIERLRREYCGIMRSSAADRSERAGYLSEIIRKIERRTGPGGGKI